MKLRKARLTDLYNAFEDYNDELALLDANERHQNEFETIRERFYSIAAKIERSLNETSTSSAASVRTSVETRIDNTENITSTIRRRIKLPEASLPTFDGRCECWLSFKNAFNNVIGSQTDLSDIDKLHYLKSALIGEAANKIRIFEIDGINYSKAWNLLERSYEVKRILISRQLTLISKPVLEKETSANLSKLADDIQQHVPSLNTLGVSVGP